MELIAGLRPCWQSVRMLLPAMKTTVIAAVLSLLAACASVPPAQDLLAETDDLAVVADAALQLADRHGRDKVLVVFDIDNTLLAMEQGLGSDQWYYWQKDLEKEDPCSGDLVNNRFSVQGALYFASALRPTQPDVAEQIIAAVKAHEHQVYVTITPALEDRRAPHRFLAGRLERHYLRDTLIR